MTTTSTQAELNTKNLHSNSSHGVANANNARTTLSCQDSVVDSVNAGTATTTATNSQSSNSNSNNNNNNNNKQLHPQQQQNNTSGNSHTQKIAGVSDCAKRKKLKSRTANAAPHQIFPQSSAEDYAKEHLDAWLDNCLRDAASNAQLSSSSEFLDFNPMSNKQMFAAFQQQQQQKIPIVQPQQQQPQQQQQQQQQINLATQFQGQTQTQTQNHAPHSQLQQQQFLLRTNSQPYTTAIYGMSQQPAPPFSLGIQRHTPSYMRSTHSLSNRFPPHLFSTASNGFYNGSSNDGAQDFASLPPIVNLMSGLDGGSNDNTHNSTDVLDGSGSNPNICRGFSDPCLLNPSDNDSKISGQNTPDQRGTISTNELDQNKFFAALMEQINILHETNSKICRNLHETKVDIEALKHTSPHNWATGGMRHRRDSLSGLSTQSQPMVFGGGFGTQSPAPTFHSVAGAYTPGMMTDVVREVKEAARVREDALLNRVKAMVEERQWSMNEGNIRMLRDIDELKTHVLHLRLERKEVNKRLNHLETENRYMRQLLATLYNNRNSQPDVIYEHEALRTSTNTRKSHPNARRTQSLNLHYGIVHQQPVTTTGCLDGEIADDVSNEGAIVDSCAVGNLSNGSANTNVPQSPPNFSLVAPTVPVRQDKQRKREQQQQQQSQPQQQQQAIDAPDQLQQELNEAVAARKEADQRIIALEKLVRNLNTSASTTVIAATTSNNLTNGIGIGIGVGSGVDADTFAYNLDNSNNSTIHNTLYTSAPNWNYAYDDIFANERQPEQQEQQQNEQKEQQQQQQHQQSCSNLTCSSYTFHNINKTQTNANSNPNNIGNNLCMGTVITSAVQPKLSLAGPITDL